MQCLNNPQKMRGSQACAAQKKSPVIDSTKQSNKEWDQVTFSSSLISASRVLSSSSSSPPTLRASPRYLQTFASLYHPSDLPACRETRRLLSVRIHIGKLVPFPAPAARTRHCALSVHPSIRRESFPHRFSFIASSCWRSLAASRRLEQRRCSSIVSFLETTTW